MAAKTKGRLNADPRLRLGARFKQVHGKRHKRLPYEYFAGLAEHVANFLKGVPTKNPLGLPSPLYVTCA
jgi:hypothetical protein